MVGYGLQDDLRARLGSAVAEVRQRAHAPSRSLPQSPPLRCVVSGLPIPALDRLKLFSTGEWEAFVLEWDPASLWQGGGCTDALSPLTDEVTVHSDDPDEPSVSVALEGCCDGTGYNVCGMVDFEDILACFATCPDLATGIHHCIILGQNSC